MNSKVRIKVILVSCILVLNLTLRIVLIDLMPKLFGLDNESILNLEKILNEKNILLAYGVIVLAILLIIEEILIAIKRFICSRSLENKIIILGVAFINCLIFVGLGFKSYEIVGNYLYIAIIIVAAIIIVRTNKIGKNAV